MITNLYNVACIVMKNKRKIIILTILGIIPFYSKHLFYFFNDGEFNLLLKKLSLLYGALIVSFLSGMQWQRIIFKKNDFKYLILPMIPLLLVWLYQSFFFESYQELLIIICLILSFFIDYKLINNTLQKWYLDLRAFATFMAVLSYFI
ncbi:MAG: hypothetical protein CFH30_00533 [Alphaproteobacteria bacterium MarineAlpha8_Bin1]|nr:MAG: hypothetical protein CFH30_00533 [Alphaproteobacteria bacterium MarineAlpha8_Bin1]